MKHTLYFILFLCLVSCQPKDSSRQTPPDSPPLPDTTAAVAPPPPAPAAPDPAYLIVPGQRMGQVKLGMTAQKVYAILGEADSSDAAMGKALSFWISPQAGQPQHYLVVYTVTDFGSRPERPLVQQVQVNSPKFRTESGIGTGDALSRIRQEFSALRPLAHYPGEQGQQVYIFDDRAQGIAFEVSTPDSLCTAITIHPKGENVTDTYLPLHPEMTRLNRP